MKPILGLTKKDGSKKPFDPASFDITKEQPQVIQTNARGMNLFYGSLRGAEYYNI